MPFTVNSITYSEAAGTVTLSGAVNWSYLGGVNVQFDPFFARTTTDYEVVLPYENTPFDPDFRPSDVPNTGNMFDSFGLTAGLSVGDYGSPSTSTSVTNADYGYYALPQPAEFDRAPTGIYAYMLILDQVGGTLSADETEVFPDQDQWFFFIGMDSDYETITDISLRKDDLSATRDGSYDTAQGATLQYLLGVEAVNAPVSIDDALAAAGLSSGGGGGGGGGGSDGKTIKGSRKADDLSGTSGDDTLVGRKGKDSLSGLAGDDTLNGGSGKDRLEGGADDDVLRGANGKDKLFGDAGDDILDGGRGKDRLEGGAGDDALTGGKARDVFVFGGDWGTDTVVDLDADADSLVFLSEVRSASDFSGNLTASGNDVIYDDATTLGNVIVFQDTTIGELRALDIEVA